MKKTISWTAAGAALSVIFGLGGLGHLSATVFTLTVFLSAEAFLTIGFNHVKNQWSAS